MAYTPPNVSLVSTANSTTTNLAGGATFTGTSEEVKDYSTIQVSVYSSHASATDGLSIQQSSDGTNWDIIDTYTVSAAIGKTFSFQPAARYYRLVYTNGGTLTTSLRIQSVFHYATTKSSSQRPQDALSNENDFEQVSSYPSVYNGTTWDRMRGDITNGLDVDVTRLPTLAAVTTVSTVTTLTGSSLANDAIDAGNPHKIGGQARITNPTAVQDADRVNFIADKLGKQVVVGSIRDLKADATITLTSTTETTLIAAIASTFNDVYGLIATNTSATASEVIIRDVTAGTARFSVMVPAGETRGFMLPESGAFKQATVNTAWTAQLGTAVTSMKITALYVKNI